MGEAAALARALDDGVRLGWMLTRMAFVLNVTGDFDDAMAMGEQALALAALGDSALQMEASARIEQLYLFIGDFGRAVELLRWSVQTADRECGTSSTTWRIMARAYLAWTLSELGAFTEGQRYGEEALRLATLAGRGTAPLVAHGFLGHLYLTQGNLEPAMRVLEQGLALWITGLSEVCRLEGRGEEAWKHAYQALDLARQHKERGNEARAAPAWRGPRPRRSP